MIGFSRVLKRFAPGLLTISCLAVLAPDAWACGCAGPLPTSRLNESANAVFIGKVVGILRPPQPESQTKVVENADGTTSVSVVFPAFPLASQVRFSVERSFKGVSNTEVILSRGGTSCDYQFAPGETYMVFAYSMNGALEASKCTRPLPLSQATEAVKYLDGLRANRPQALLYGLALHRGADQGGKPVFERLEERLTVHAEAAGMSVETRTNEANEYELVLPPGQYRVWLLRNGETVSEPLSLSVSPGATTLRTLVTFPGK